jgi:hypothetical protein
MSNARNIADRGHKILAYVEVASGDVGVTSNEFNISSSVDVQGSNGNGHYVYNFATELSNPANYHVFVQMNTDRSGSDFIRCTNRSASNFTIKTLYEGGYTAVYQNPHSCVVIGKSD